MADIGQSEILPLLAVLAAVITGIAAAVGAWFQYKEYRRRGQDQFIEHGPFLRVDWRAAYSLPSSKREAQANGNKTKCQFCSVLTNEPWDGLDRECQNLLTALKAWWEEGFPNFDARYSYLLLCVSNTQVRPHASAAEIRAKLDFRIASRGYPPESQHEIRLLLGMCPPETTVCVPLRIEGVEWLRAEIKELSFTWRGQAHKEKGKAWDGKEVVGINRLNLEAPRLIKWRD